MVARPERGAVIELSIIVPAFNEAYRLPAVIDALRHHTDDATTEIIVVDDGSDDDTAEVAKRTADWSSHFVLLRHDENRGKGAAVRTGVAAARGEVIGFIDADNATDLAALDDMVALIGGTVGAVFGSRHAPGASVTGSPAIRGLMGRVFNHVVKFAAGTKIRDTQCGGKVFRGPAARISFGTASLDGFAFDVEVLRSMLAMGFDVIEHPVHWHYVHGTKIKALTPLRMLVDIARIRMRPAVAEMHFVDAVWSDGLARRADPLFASSHPVPGDPVRVLLPGLDGQPLADATRQIRGELDGASIQSRTWLQLIGTSAS